jgi:hypothetical protein
MHGNDCDWIEDYDGQLIGTLMHDEWSEADRRLATASTDLLAACEAMLAQIGRPGMAEARQKALDAVAKARGE